MEMGAMIRGCSVLMLRSMILIGWWDRVLMPVVSTQAHRIVMHGRIPHILVVDLTVTRLARHGLNGRH